MTMRVMISGADGFIGKNLRLSLSERNDIEIISLTRADKVDDLPRLLEGIDFVVHLASVNRPDDPKDFSAGNADFTRALCEALMAQERPIPVIYTSSSQAANNNPYGISKAAAESELRAFGRISGSPVHIFRLPNVFGKWARPDYNSAIATFCHNIVRGLPITVHDPSAILTLVYIDDVVDCFVRIIDGAPIVANQDGFVQVDTTYQSSVGAIAEALQSFKDSRDNLITRKVGAGLFRALYSTYVSYLPTEAFSYPVPMHGDARGTFVEMLKTEDSGQFSYFTAHPGVTRGGHYHHSKTEKFLVMKGKAHFKFRHMGSGETYALETSGAEARVVETVPGWTHDITNVGDDEMLVMLWANEIFDRERPDTYACPL